MTYGFAHRQLVDPTMQTFAIIPAAGRSVRMGQPKLLLPWGQTTLLEHVLAT
jgi:CTP:molybdopterin cytidylyltransferase MocA